MTKMRGTYLGHLRVECEHLQSGEKITTDAPLENGGLGKAFSPTDLCAAALASCIVTAMAAYAENHGIDLSGLEMDIEKIIADERIGQIDIVLNMPDRVYTDKEKMILQRVAHTCGVHNSLSEKVIQNIIFRWKL